MKAQSYSNRIALNFMTATAVLIMVIFTTIYLVVYNTVFSHLDDDLNAEYLEVSNSIVDIDGQMIFTNPNEWAENEHGQIEVNPTFIQVADNTGIAIKRSPNLRGTSLEVFQDENQKVFLNSKLANDEIRQLQMVLKNEAGQKIGYISVAIPLQESQMVLRNLLLSLLMAFPFVLLVLYFVTKYMAQRSLAPVKTLTESAEKITRENLNERIELPTIKDELHTLTGTINNLLDRLEDTLLREKQFSSDASHELRTPLAVLKGTLEVMIRKPREPQYYLEKAGTCLEEVNRMSVLVDQLLLLARHENSADPNKLSEVNLSDVVDRLIARHAVALEQKEITLNLQIGSDPVVRSAPFMVEQILENIFSNAIKYSPQSGTIAFLESRREAQTALTIKDEGRGMESKELSDIFNRFYRADESRNAQIKGYGLGLAITKRFADLLHIQIKVESEIEKGTAFTLVFPE